MALSSSSSSCSQNLSHARHATYECEPELRAARGQIWHEILPISPGLPPGPLAGALAVAGGEMQSHPPYPSPLHVWCSAKRVPARTLQRSPHMLQHLPAPLLPLQVLQVIGAPTSGRDEGEAVEGGEGAGHSDAVLCVDAHPLRPILASCGHERDGRVKLYAHQTPPR